MRRFLPAGFLPLYQRRLTPKRILLSTHQQIRRNALSYTSLKPETNTIAAVVPIWRRAAFPLSWKLPGNAMAPVQNVVHQPNDFYTSSPFPIHSY